MVAFIISLGLCAEELCSTFVAAVRYNLFLFCHSELVDGYTKQKKDFPPPPAFVAHESILSLVMCRTQRSLQFSPSINVEKR